MFKLFKKVKSALKKTRFILGDKIRGLFGRPLDEDTFEDLERILYESDLGTACAIEFTEYVSRKAKEPEQILDLMKEYAHKLLSTPPQTPAPKEGSPHVILIVGVNGSGKTTSCAKLAQMYRQENKSVLLAAGDTFRAAAIEQLTSWADKIGVDIVKGRPKGDPSSVIFDALTAAKARGTDVVIADTAGRLQSKKELMHELAKIKRVCEKVVPDSPHEILLVLDATTGQNAVDQARTFNEFTPLTGLILTKLDGSAKGGVVLSIYRELGIPINFIGLGEGMDDLTPFDANDYIEALFK